MGAPGYDLTDTRTHSFSTHAQGTQLWLVMAELPPHQQAVSRKFVQLHSVLPAGGVQQRVVYRRVYPHRDNRGGSQGPGPRAPGVPWAQNPCFSPMLWVWVGFRFLFGSGGPVRFNWARYQPELTPPDPMRAKFHVLGRSLVRPGASFWLPDPGGSGGDPGGSGGVEFAIPHVFDPNPKSEHTPKMLDMHP